MPATRELAPLTSRQTITRDDGGIEKANTQNVIDGFERQLQGAAWISCNGIEDVSDEYINNS